jgi:predicted nuclease of predicted toxin-antitoxin system
VEVKLLLDDISPKVGEMLRDQDGLDAVQVRERGLLQAADRDVLERAYAEDRVLVTKNVEDFVKLARARDLHPGILLLEDGDLVRDEQLRVVRAAVALLGPERDLVNRVLRVCADGRHVFEDGDEVSAAQIGS